MGLSISFVITVVFIFEFSPILLAANLSANPHLRPAQFFNFFMGGDENICKSRDYLNLVSASPIHNSKGRAFSCTVALELSNPPFSNASLRKIFFSFD